MSYPLRPAGPGDLLALQNFLHGQNYLYRHLDWRDPLEWLGREPFFLLEEKYQLLATLAAPPEPAGVAWVRLFGASPGISTETAWKALFEPCRAYLESLSPRPVLVSLALRDWYGSLLEGHGFARHQDIVVFLYDQTDPPPPVSLEAGIRLRKLEIEDLDQVAEIDHLSFESIWQLSRDDLRFAYQKSSYMTVAEREGQIIAYQMSSKTGMYAHLARLAVHPDLQRRRIGYALVQDLLKHFLNLRNCWGVTLNTQHNNPSSIALYERMGFRATGERFPVYVYPLE